LPNRGRKGVRAEKEAEKEAEAEKEGRKGVRSFFVIFLSGFNAMFIGLREVE